MGSQGARHRGGAHGWGKRPFVLPILPHRARMTRLPSTGANASSFCATENSQPVLHLVVGFNACDVHDALATDN